MKGALGPRQELDVLDGTKERLLVARVQATVSALVQQLERVLAREHHVARVAALEVA
jgi:hypothetical protein